MHMDRPESSPDGAARLGLVNTMQFWYMAQSEGLPHSTQHTMTCFLLFLRFHPTGTDTHQAAMKDAKRSQMVGLLIYCSLLSSKNQGIEAVRGIPFLLSFAPNNRRFHFKTVQPIATMSKCNCEQPSRPRRSKEVLMA